MTINQQMFMYAAEELNFTKAAMKAYVTQQCLSNHISRLEKEYGTKLFNRTKKGVTLTPAGELLYKAFTSINMIEENVTNEIQSTGENVKGTVKIGVPSGYGTILVPTLLQEYKKVYPGVKVEVVLDHTDSMFKMLEVGKIDFFLGRDIWPTQDVDNIILTREKFFLFISKQLLNKYDIQVSENNTISMVDIAKVPLMMMPGKARSTSKIREYMATNNITLNEACTVDSYASMMFLTKLNEYAFIGPECLKMSNIYRDDIMLGDKHEIEAYRIENLNSDITMSVVTNKNHYLTSYARDLLQIISNLYKRSIDKINQSKIV